MPVRVCGLCVFVCPCMFVYHLFLAYVWDDHIPGGGFDQLELALAVFFLHVFDRL